MEYSQNFAEENPKTTITVTTQSDHMYWRIQGEREPSSCSVHVIDDVLPVDCSAIDLMAFWTEVFKLSQPSTINNFNRFHPMDVWVEAVGQMERLLFVMGQAFTALDFSTQPNVTLHSSDFIIPTRINTRLVSITVECVTNLVEEELDLTPGV